MGFRDVFIALIRSKTRVPVLAPARFELAVSIQTVLRRSLTCTARWH